MTIARKILAAAAPLALLVAGGCAQTFTANVARFQRLPEPTGQTFRIVPTNPRFAGGLEFGSYASLVSHHLAQFGYRPIEGAGPADMVVQLDYGVDRGQQKVTTTPGFDCGGWGGGWGGWGGGWGGWGGGFGGWGRGWGGWGGPGWRYGWGGFGCPDVESYTIYSSYLAMHITRTDGVKLFEGRARAHSTTDNLTVLVPNLIDAMFTGFPGNSGQDIRITVTPEQQRQRRAAPGGAPMPAPAPMPAGGPTS
ncbi:DUF4136 domain-containing protein [Sphingomonas morindae]|uniref:DUF4136 domain-containing protein n=1 Tax=Sphingomonas morindae TaxID=1541170 RepID=A0ABY4XAI6_9SPHN|nr:DUF4136 domain-containing protein [Sphingomonas morindae]USI73957.1 DUF4136 domain-containing protein [Sphingomonas morindae]